MQSLLPACIEFKEVIEVRKFCFSLLLPVLGMFLLILDGKTSISGATEGITLCLQTVIPSLFPFFVLSAMVTAGLTRYSIRFLSPIGRLLRIPDGSEGLWLIGMLGGYPVGARAIRKANQDGFLSDSNFRRMMAFCSNSGPAFIFGIGSHLFSDGFWCWLIWSIHVVSAVIVAVLTPGGDRDRMTPKCVPSVTIGEALESAIKTMSLVCGWVILFRIIIAFCQRWFLWALPQPVRMLFLGLLELANGCTLLCSIPEESIRFVFFSVFLGFGGLCVTMQTWSLCDGKHLNMYLAGKLTQGLLSGFMAGMVISREMRMEFGVFLVFTCTAYYFLSRFGKKRLDFSVPLLYDKRKIHSR